MNDTFWIIIIYILLGTNVISGITSFMSGGYAICKDFIWQDAFKEFIICIVSFITCVISLISVCVLGCKFCS